MFGQSAKKRRHPLWRTLAGALAALCVLSGLPAPLLAEACSEECCSAAARSRESVPAAPEAAGGCCSGEPSGAPESLKPCCADAPGPASASLREEPPRSASRLPCSHCAMTCCEGGEAVPAVAASAHSAGDPFSRRAFSMMAPAAFDALALPEGALFPSLSRWNAPTPALRSVRAHLANRVLLR